MAETEGNISGATAGAVGETPSSPDTEAPSGGEEQETRAERDQNRRSRNLTPAERAALTRTTPGRGRRGDQEDWGAAPSQVGNRYSYVRGKDAEAAIDRHFQKTFPLGEKGFKAFGWAGRAVRGLAAWSGVVVDNFTGQVVPGYLDEAGVLQQPFAGIEDPNAPGVDISIGGSEDPGGRAETEAPGPEEPATETPEPDRTVPQWLIDAGFQGTEAPAWLQDWNAFRGSLGNVEGTLDDPLGINAAGSLFDRMTAARVGAEFVGGY